VSEKSVTRWAGNALTGVLAAFLVVAVVTGPPSPEARVATLAEKVRCPQCLVSVADSSSQIAKDMRLQIEEWVAAGWSDNQVLDAFAAAYGEHILLDPRPSGATLALYGIPLLFIVIGSWMAINRQRNPVDNGRPQVENQ